MNKWQKMRQNFSVGGLLSGGSGGSRRSGRSALVTIVSTARIRAQDNYQERALVQGTKPDVPQKSVVRRGALEQAEGARSKGNQGA